MMSPIAGMTAQYTPSSVGLTATNGVHNILAVIVVSIVARHGASVVNVIGDFLIHGQKILQVVFCDEIVPAATIEGNHFADFAHRNAADLCHGTSGDLENANPFDVIISYDIGHFDFPRERPQKPLAKPP